MTLQMFYSVNNVPYNSFEKYLKTWRGMSDIHRVNITGITEEETKSSVESRTRKEPEEEMNPDRDTQTQILVNIEMTNGIWISKANLSYRKLIQLVKKLERYAEYQLTQKLLLPSRPLRHEVLRSAYAGEIRVKTKRKLYKEDVDKVCP